MRTTVQSFGLSLATFPVASAAFGVALISFGAAKPPGLRGTLVLLLIATLSVAVAEALVLIPLLYFCNRLRLARAVKAVVGALHGCIPLLLLILVFHDSDDPATLREYLVYWSRVPGELLVVLLPSAASGAVLALASPDPFAHERLSDSA